MRWQKKISLLFISLHFFTIYNWYLNFEWQYKQHKCISPPNQTLVAYVCGLKLDVHLMFCNATSVGTVTSHFIRILHHQNATDSTNLEGAGGGGACRNEMMLWPKQALQTDNGHEAKKVTSSYDHLSPVVSSTPIAQHLKSWHTHTHWDSTSSDVVFFNHTRQQCLSTTLDIIWDNVRCGAKN